MQLEPIGNESVVSEVLKRITESIKDGDIKPGEKLPTEVELMKMLGVGRNSVREAIKMLGALGVLEIRRGSGTYIATKVTSDIFNPMLFSIILEPKTSEDLYELRVMFESMVLFTVIDKATPEDIEGLNSLLDHTRRLFKEGNKDLERFVMLDMEFHKKLVKATRNPLIIRIYDTIIELFHNYIKKSLAQKNGIPRSLKNHYEIIRLIESKNKAKVFEIVEQTLLEWKNKWEEE